MKSSQIRKLFLEYFEKTGHTIVPSSSLIPAEDPTLLFTNAGMNQFKDCFLGKEKRSYTRAATIQKCVRAGGKHNDLDQVGYTQRHLTFFEMMGNFSFGDYFKKEAIPFAWNLLVEGYKLPVEKLWVTIYKDDEQSYEIWRNDMNISEDRIVRLGEVDNFWAMGDTGPCGPCTEIYIDRGKEVGCGKNCLPGCECDRYLEIWNNVFMQYNRQADGTLKELTQTGVDTGMGFERIAMVMQNQESVFEIDSFRHLIEKTEELSGVKHADSTGDRRAAFHVLGDHIRTSALLIADGCSPSNDGRGYVLRKIIRRAALFAQKLTTDNTLFSQLGHEFIAQMGDVYPELKTNKTLIISVLESEIERFATNLVTGKNIFEKYAQQAKQEGKTIIAGEHVFKLYDTYGFPPELTEIMGKENGLTIDHKGFETAMEQAKAISGKKMKSAAEQDFNIENLSTKFVGYETLESTSTIQFVSPAEDGSYWVSTQESPFFVECGGQVDDQGWITINEQKFEVCGLKKAGETFKPAILVKISGTTVDGQSAKPINVGDTALSVVDSSVRPHTVKNHTATHMLQAALIQVLGPQVKQAGSVVHDKYLRFDFTHHQPMTAEQIKQTEDIVNQKIWDDIKTSVEYATLKEAKNRGVISFFGEKYNPEEVRIVDIPGFSQELCGGTHASSTGTIGCFKIASESALSTGVRRIFALTGPEAVRTFQESFSTVKKLAEKFKAKPEEVLQAIDKQQRNLQEALTQVKQLKKQLYKAQLPVWQQQVETIANVPFLYLELDDASNDEMKMIAQELDSKQPGFYFIVSKAQGNARFSFFAAINKTHTEKINLKDFATYARNELGLKGGGSPSQLQGGGTSLPQDFKQKISSWANK